MYRREPQFSRGQEVTFGKLGPLLLVISIDEDRVLCVDPDSGKTMTCNARQLCKAS